MKIEMEADGMLIISSETYVEEYALHKWCKDNISNDGNQYINGRKILFKGFDNTKNTN